MKISAKQVKTVSIGQRFQSIGAVTGAPAFSYEVQAVFKSRVDNVEYARIALIGDATQIKSISAATLLNPKQFIALPPAPERGSHQAA